MNKFRNIFLSSVALVLSLSTIMTVDVKGATGVDRISGIQTPVRKVRASDYGSYGLTEPDGPAHGASVPTILVAPTWYTAEGYNALLGGNHVKYTFDADDIANGINGIKARTPITRYNAGDGNVVYQSSSTHGATGIKQTFVYSYENDIFCLSPESRNRVGNSGANEKGFLTDVLVYKLMDKHDNPDILDQSGLALIHIRMNLMYQTGSKASVNKYLTQSDSGGRAAMYTELFGNTHLDGQSFEYPIALLEDDVAISAGIDNSFTTTEIADEAIEYNITQVVTGLNKFKGGGIAGWSKGPLIESIASETGYVHPPAFVNLVMTGSTSTGLQPSSIDWAGGTNVSGMVKDNSNLIASYKLTCSKADREAKTVKTIPAQTLNFSYDLEGARSSGILAGSKAAANLQNMMWRTNVKLKFKVNMPEYKITCDTPPPPSTTPTPPPVITPSPGDCPSGSYELTSVVDLRWYNLPLAYAEVKDGIGYNLTGETTNGKYAANRSSEEFEGMMGVPETEKLYINGGTSEGQMDTSYTHHEGYVTYGLKWSEVYECPGHIDADGNPWSHYEGTVNYCRSYKHNFSFLHLENSSYRAANSMSIANPELFEDGSFIIPASPAIDRSHTLTPLSTGLNEVWGVGSDRFNHGAETSTSLNFTAGPYNHTCTYPGPLNEGDAISEANEATGNVFAQSDELVIKIGGEEYPFARQNKISVAPYGNSSPLISNLKTDFIPMDEVWDTQTKVKFTGYNGEPETGSSRNKTGSLGTNTPLLKEDIKIKNRLVNGIYNSGAYETSNYVIFDKSSSVKGAVLPLHNDTSEMQGIVLAKSDVFNTAHYLQGNDKVKVQYTNWQASAGTHNSNEPDGVRDQATVDNPNYYSINPIIIHNPTVAMYSWISDIQENILSDQRIVEGQYEIQRHERAIDSRQPSRQYVDFDFEVTMPNHGPFESYWSDQGGNGRSDLTKAGIEDADEVSPGTRGKGYIGTPQARVLDRQYNNPYSTQQWNVEKWINSKYVQFPYEVYYYKNSGELGGSPAGFYGAGVWIRLYDDSYEVKAGDPTKFNFHVVSNQKDLADGQVKFLSEAINAPPSLRGNADALFNDAEYYVNGRRDKSYTYAMAASHSAKQDVLVDGIGRIGNSIVDDSSDPAWAEVFWYTGETEYINTSIVGTKAYAMYHNMFDVKTGSRLKYNRWDTLDWHVYDDFYKLPVMKNPLEVRDRQTQKLGYENQASVQTLGDHDGRMFVYPKYKLVGNYSTGSPSTQDFMLFAVDPFDKSSKLKSFYDSRHGIGYDYVPNFKYILNHTLIDTRAKLGETEKLTDSYLSAKALGSTKTYSVGTPSWIDIGKDLRTHIGSTSSTGRLGATNVGEMTSSSNSLDAWKNAQRWNFRFSLPKTTQVVFLEDSGLTDNSKVEGRTKDQYIYTEFVYRTWNGFNLWDLTTFTNTGVTSPMPANEIELDHEYVPEIPYGPNTVTVEDVVDDGEDNEVLTGDPDDPTTPEIIVDYSNPADTDKTTIGTH